MKGSTVGVVKGALIDLLQARPGIAGANVSYEGPIKATDIKTDDGLLEAIWVGNADSDQDVVIFKGLPLYFEDIYELEVVIQVIRPTTDGTQREADERAVALLGELLGLLASNPLLSIADPDFRRCEVTPQSWRHITGHLPNGKGFGSRFEVRLGVDGRIAIT